MEQKGVFVFRGSVNCSGAQGQEKGADVRIALDTTQLILDRVSDIATIFSTDQDFKQIRPTASNIVQKIGTIFRIKSAFPRTAEYNIRGIDGTDWIKFGMETYHRSFDTQNYWPR